MKITIKYILPILLGFFLMTSCEDDKENHETVISSFEYITSDFSITLQNVQTDTITLEWSKATAQDYTLVFYEVEFALSSTGFDNPDDIEILTPTKLGSSPFIKLTDYDLNVLAERLGVKQSTTGTLVWRVKASNGINQYMPESTRKIEVTRPSGFAKSPETIFLAGSATSAGDDLSQAIRLKVSPLNTSVFEGICDLKSGELYMVSNKTSKHRFFSIINNELKEDEGAINCPSNGLYHIRINFETGAADFSLISKVQQVKVGTPEVLISDLNYSGNLTWEAQYNADDLSIKSGNQYKFKVLANSVADGSLRETYWGSPNVSSSPPNTSLTDNYYYVIRDESAYTPLQYYYRFPTTVAGKTIKVVLYMGADLENWYHTCTYVE